MSWQPPPGPPGPPPHGWGQPPQGPVDPYGSTQAMPATAPPHGFGAQPGAALQPDRSALLLVLALSSFMALFVGCSACGPLGLVSLGLSIPAIAMARRDLRAIDAGQMVRTGRDATNVAMIIAIVSTIISLLVGLLMVMLMIFYGGLFGIALLSAAAGA